ncbi:hypothetical protein [Pedomonas mirosovicensis]|uniref:hypothetical protein n=1 Tax=Pedomonas mirosovicensis TaxID=2908641 RepID=UPI00216981D8|nr:hypothetical protein [Pedomonas mirosovicensis]MCH8686006.1 hypothetical protein [Pedomonas mirosovicensis]
MSVRPVVAVLVSRDMLPWAENRRVDAHEGDAQVALMRQAFARIGRDMEIVQWDGEGIDWSRFEAAITSITWDYAERPEAFLARLGEIAGRTRLINSLEVIRWNMRKTYLKDLAERGAQLVPTHWVERATPEAAEAAFAAFGVDRIVIKPVVGAGAWRQVLLRRGEAWPDAEALPPHEAMIQPFLPAIQDEGEYSFLFFNGQFSHAVVKTPKQGGLPYPDELWRLGRALSALGGRSVGRPRRARFRAGGAVPCPCRHGARGGRLPAADGAGADRALFVHR